MYSTLQMFNKFPLYIIKEVNFLTLPCITEMHKKFLRIYIHVESSSTVLIHEIKYHCTYTLWMKVMNFVSNKGLELVILDEAWLTFLWFYKGHTLYVPGAAFIMRVFITSSGIVISVATPPWLGENINPLTIACNISKSLHYHGYGRI